MTTPITSPSALSTSMSMSNPPHPFPSEADSSTLDFLSFMGLDQNQNHGQNQQYHNQQYDGPSNTPQPQSQDVMTPEAGPSSRTGMGTGVGGRRGSNDSSRGRTRNRTTNRDKAGKHERSTSSSTSIGQDVAAMEVDQIMGDRGGGSNGSGGHVQPFGPSQLMGMMPQLNTSGSNGTELGLGAILASPGFDASQAHLLQQLEHIHMQSPLTFDTSNSQSPFHPMAQMFLTSPIVNMSSLPTNGNQQESSNAIGEEEREQLKKQWAMPNGYGGMYTPAPSGDMFPQVRTDHMSPMQLEMLARAENEFNMTPLLSPALSQQQSASNYTSPANQSAFSNSTPQQYHPNRSPLEQLQEQQRQFQEQLVLLQQQQRELQATAAAVAASSSAASAANSAHSSPYVPTHHSASAPGRPATTPGLAGPHSAGSISTPSPGYFSPLTSPALEANRSGHFGHHQYNRQPHPLSALSSPALNPVGSSGGAQQTLSPALEPQSNADMADPDYIRALVGLLENNGNGSGNQNDQNLSPQFYQFPAMGSQHQSSPLVGPSGQNASGPHRHSLPSKSRPSPMMKPIHHRSHAHGHSGHNKHGSTSGGVPTSPAIQRVAQASIPGMGYLPPAAIQPQQQYVSGGGQGPTSIHSGLSSSTTSTPSPVDLAQMMPPPPVPGTVNQKGMIPMTPASLMNLGSSSRESSSRDSRENVSTPMPPPPKRQASRSTSNPTPTQSKSNAKKATAPNAVGNRKGANSSSNTSARLAPSSAAGKRALAMRPPGIGVRAATKGAAAAAATPLPEGETRKTSHKAAEQKRRDSLKAGFDELRLLLPPINTEALDPESGEPIPGSSAPRLLPKSSLVPDDNPNRGVSKVALLKFSNEYIVKLHDKVDKRDGYIDKLREEVRRLRDGNIELDEVRGEEGEDLLEMDMLEGEEEDFGEGEGEGDGEGEEGEEFGEGGDGGDGEGDDDEGMDEGDEEEEAEVITTNTALRRRSAGGQNVYGNGNGNGNGWKKSPALNPIRRPSLGKRASSSAATVKGR